MGELCAENFCVCTESGNFPSSCGSPGEAWCPTAAACVTECQQTCSPPSCQDFSLGRCPDYNVIHFESLPCPPGVAWQTCAHGCQSLCASYSGCNMFRYTPSTLSHLLHRLRSYNHETGICEYISAAGGSPSYYNQCGLAAGPALPLLDQCVTGLPRDPCDQFHGENCQYASQESQHNQSHYTGIYER